MLTEDYTFALDCPGAAVCHNRCDQHPCPFCDPEKLPEARQSVLGPGHRWFWIFEPLNPVVPGHRLVVPKVHVRDAVADPWVAAAAMDVAARLIRDHHESANIITSIGAAATQSVFHLYVHVVPRIEGDGLHLPWTGQAEREAQRQLDLVADADREGRAGDIRQEWLGEWPLAREECDHNPGVSCAEISRKGNGHCCREYPSRKGDPGTSSRPVEDLPPPPGGPAPGRPLR